MFLVLLALLGVVLLLGPIIVPAVLGVHIASVAVVILMLLGIVLLTTSMFMGVISKLYVRTSSSSALVRTGMGGMAVVKDGGSLFIPMVHNATRVTLQTVRLAVERKDADALITHDKLRADIHAEFFVRVQPDDKSIINASRSFGDKMDTDSIKRVVEDKLVSALRQVAATKTLEELNTKRDEFMKEVRSVLTGDLEANGLTLETATISRLDQTNPKALRDDNIFDAQGKRAIAEITQRQLTERNAIERHNEQARAEQDVATRQQILKLEQQRTQAELVQKTEIAAIQAEQTRQAQEKTLEAAQAVELTKVGQAQTLRLAQVGQEQAVRLAEVEQARLLSEAKVRQEQAVKLAQVGQDQAVRLAEVQQVQAVEIADRQRATQVAEAEQSRALAEAKRAEVEAERARALQNVQTVEVQAAAERAKRQKVIEAEALADQKLIEAQRSADAKAYAVQKDAEAQRASADAAASAVLKKAEADAKAQTLRAEGLRAEALVPVQVAQQQMEVERQRVAVLQQEMQARTEHGAAQQEFELAKLRIQGEVQVKIESARATATLLGKVNANVYGTPEDVARMTGHFMRGMGLSQVLEGGLAGTSDSVRDVASRAVEQVAQAAKDLVGKKDAPALPNNPT